MFKIQSIMEYDWPCLTTLAAAGTWYINVAVGTQFCDFRKSSYNMNIEMVLAMAVKLALTVMWDVEGLGCLQQATKPPSASHN